MRLALTLMAVLVATAITETYVAERLWPTTFLTYAPQQPFGLPVVLLLIITLARRDWRAFGISAAAAALILVFFLGIPVRWPWHSHGVSSDLGVMTVNVARLTRASADEVAALAKREGIDIVCLQETNPKDAEIPTQKLLQTFSGWHSVTDREIAIFSRYPIRAHRHRRLADSARLAVAAEVAPHGKPITVIGIHFNTGLQPRPNEKPRGVAERMRSSALVREQQATALLSFVNETNTPVLVLGDLNTPPRGLIYRKITAKLQDGHAASGRGTGFTFPARRPLMRIDYVLAGEGVKVTDCRVVSVKISDHLPVVAEVALR